MIGGCLPDMNVDEMHTLIADSLAPKSGFSPEHIKKFMNLPANWLKHWSGRADNELVLLELETLAISYIIRAIGNLLAYDRSITSESGRFLEWVEANRPDLLAGENH